MKTNKLFMAFATGKETTESGPIKRYIGVAPVFVLGVNPTKTELEAFYGGITLEKDPEYIGTTEVGPEGNRKTVPQIRIDVIVKTDPEKCEGIEAISKISFYLAKSYRFNGDQTKIQIIDKYGRTAWATSEEVKTKAIPKYASGPANIDSDYRPLYIGEEEITEFVKVYLNIPGPQDYNRTTKVWTDKTPEKKVEAEARLDKIESYFSGDIKELKSILAFQPNNKVKALFGVKTTADNKQYQTIFTGMFLRNGVTNYDKLGEMIKDRQANGRDSSVEYAVCKFREFSVQPTNFATPSGAGFPDPFATAGADNDFPS